MDSEDILKVIRRAKLDAELDIRITEDRSSSLGIERGVFIGGQSDESRDAVIRCLYKKRSSSMRLSLNSAEDLDNGVMKAYKLAKVIGSEDGQSTFSVLKHLNGPSPLSRKIGLIKNSDILSRMLAAKKAISEVQNIYSINISSGYSHTHLCAANSNGINGDWEGSVAFARAGVVAKDGVEQTTGSKEAESLDPYGIDFDEVAVGAASLAKNMLGAKQAPTFKGDLLLSPETSNLLMGELVSAMDGEDILKNRSFLVGKKGQVIASTLVSLREENLLKKSPYNRQFDDELIPTSSKDLVSGGLLQTYLHDIYSAEKMNEKPTGNGFFGQEGSSVDATNVVLKPGKIKTEDLISRIKKGIYLIETGDSPNMSTGDLSAMVMNGYYIESGEIKYPVKETMVGVNMIDLMKNISTLGSEYLGLGGVFTPALIIGGVQVSGK